MRRLILLFPLIFLCISCAGALTGSVFLDENANNLLDKTEKGVSRALFVVRKDGVLMTSGVTDAQGRFSVKLKDSGYYCVEVDQSATRQGQLVWTPKKGADAPANAFQKEAGVPVGTFKGVDSGTGTEDTEEDSSDSDTADDKKEDEKEEEPIGKIRERGVTSINPLKACSDATDFELSMNVPIRKDYAASITQLPDPVEKIISMGQTVDLQIFYPASCELLPLYFPRELKLAVNSRLYNANANRLQFSTSGQPKQPVAPAANVKEDAIAMETVPVELRGGIISPDAELTVEPKVLCPDGTTISLDTLRLKVGTFDLVTLRQSIETPERSLSQRFVHIEVENVGGGLVQGAELVMELPHLPNMDAALMPGTLPLTNCDNLEIKFVCHIDLNPGDKRTVSYRFTFKEGTPHATYAATAKMKLREDGKIIQAEEILIPWAPENDPANP